MPQIMELFRFIDMEWNVIAGSIPAYSWLVLPQSLGYDFDIQFELVLLPYEVFFQDITRLPVRHNLFFINLWVSSKFVCLWDL